MENPIASRRLSTHEERMIAIEAALSVYMNVVPHKYKEFNRLSGMYDFMIDVFHLARKLLNCDPKNAYASSLEICYWEEENIPEADKYVLQQRSLKVSQDTSFDLEKPTTRPKNYKRKSSTPDDMDL